MSVTYSKGPWEADQGCVWDADGKDVATCGELAQWSGDCFHPFDNASANARLIASAPDLLEALEDFIAGLDGANIDYDELAASARAAIARARGESK